MTARCTVISGDVGSKRQRKRRPGLKSWRDRRFVWIQKESFSIYVVVAVPIGSIHGIKKSRGKYDTREDTYIKGSAGNRG